MAEGARRAFRPHLAIACVAGLVAMPLMAKAADVERIDVVDKGIYAIVTGEQTAAADTPTGQVTAVAGETLIEATDTVAGSVGVEFGFRYVLVGAPAGETVTLDMVYTYPAPGLIDPEDGAPFFESRFSRDKIIGETIYLGYGFEADWEIVPGTWTFAIWHEGTKLAEESFEVSGP